LLPALLGLGLGGLATAGLPAQQGSPVQPAPSTAEMPEDLQPAGENAPVQPGAPLDHFDENGYPEDAAGLLAVQRDPEGYTVAVKDHPDPFLLFAQFANRQRDAVILARSGNVRDVLPDGAEVTIPYGYGALKVNSVYVSLIEGMVLPHLSDNRKEHELFPLRDWYLGVSFGLTGFTVGPRYVHAEKWIGYGQLGWNLLGRIQANLYAPFNYFLFPLHLGGGLRFPGLVEYLIGDNLWTVGGDLLLGLGDADGDPATPAFIWMPGVFFEVEKVVFDGVRPRADFRADPRPFNYRLNSFFFRLLLYLDLQNAADSSLLKLSFSAGYRYNIVGPRIPSHSFKRTEMVYIHDEYRRQIEEQRRRREERLRRRAQDG
jgi:hypothetical protein